MSGSAAYERLRDALDGVIEKPGKDDFDALCPCHDDHSPSLSVWIDDDNKLAVHCHACKAGRGEVEEALFANSDVRINGVAPEEWTPTKSDKPEAVYSYVDEDGQPLFEVLRYPEKRFKQRRKVKGRWAWDLNGTRRVLYRLPQVREAAKQGEIVYVVEGEKDVAAIEAEGAVATCNPGGAGKWSDEYSHALRGAQVLLVGDRDAAGEKHVPQVAASLRAAGVSMQVVAPRTGKDAADHLAAGHGLDEFDSAERFRFSNLAELMREGVTEVEMVVEEWLAAGTLHWMQGEPGDGKTWLALWLMMQTLRDGGRVLLADEEMGERVIVARLLALGVAPEEVERGFDYLSFPNLTRDDAEEWAALCAERRWDLVVFDSGTDFLTAAGLDENKGIDVTGWIKSFTEPVLHAGGAVLVVDHVTKGGESRGYAIGSRAKKAKSKVVWEVDVKKAFDPQRRGVVEVTRKKDNLGTNAPRKHVLSVGGDGQGRFTVESTDKILVNFEDVKEPETITKLRIALEDGKPHTRKEIEDAAGVSKSTFFKWIDVLEKRGEVVKLGNPEKREVLRWQLA